MKNKILKVALICLLVFTGMVFASCGKCSNDGDCYYKNEGSSVSKCATSGCAVEKADSERGKANVSCDCN